MIAVVDYRMGNVGSVANMLRKIGQEAELTSDADTLRRADRLILPGVGHFAKGMENLSSLGLRGVLDELVIEKKKPVLGICLGMQLMGKASEEGDAEGLGWVDARSTLFDKDVVKPALKVPHMGWNHVKPQRPSPFFDADSTEKPRFYFVHSYYVRCALEEDVLATTHYGHDFCSMFAHGNIVGVQFHPEKSHAFGMDLFKRFCAS